MDEKRATELAQARARVTTEEVPADSVTVLANLGKRIVLGMPKRLYPGYYREIHEVYVYRTP